MNHEPYETAVCAASDLGARLSADLSRARAQLEDAEARFQVAAAPQVAARLPVPFGVRRERLEARRRVSLLQGMLAGMPHAGGGSHAESA